MNSVVVLVNEQGTELGRLGAALQNHGVVTQVVDVFAGAGYPDLDSINGVVSLGGTMGSYEEETYPYLAEEKAYMRKAVEKGVPVLGICLGAQLLADALGGRAYRAPRTEAGVVPIELTAAGRSHPVLGHWGNVAFQLHQDTFELPAEAVLLARNQDFLQAFAHGSALAIQFHAEADAATAISWMKTSPERKLLNQGGLSFDEYSRQLHQYEPVLSAEAATLFERWVTAL